MFLYHGSNVPVQVPRIRPRIRALDFGQAFYLTTSFEQAGKWAKTSTLRREEGTSTVSVFECDESRLAGVHALRFERPNADWLRFVSRNRNLELDDSGYELVVGPVANDNTMPVLNLFFKGAYTEEEALRRLLPQRLCDQWAFKTESALACLSFVESREVE